MIFDKTKRKILKSVNTKAMELANDIEHYDDGDELDKKTSQLEALLKVQTLLKQPKLSKETTVELIKLFAVLAALGIVIYYDQSGHVIPKSLERWIPGPRL